MTLLSCHQPNFIPWYPYFQKIQECDLFVIQAHCQYEKENFQNRFNVNDRWFTMSVNKGIENIMDKKYVNPKKDWKYITSFFPKLKIFDGCIHDSLAATNTMIIMRACEILGIKTPLIADYPTTLMKTERLVDLCKSFGASKYLSGISGKKYLDLSQFEKAGIKVVFQDETKMIKKPLIEFL